MQDLGAVRAAFTDPEEFWSSPLYRRLSAVVAGDPFLLGLAAQARDGQVPTFVFFGAVHALVLAGVDHPLADHFASVRGADAAPPEGADRQLAPFARTFEAELAGIIRARLVQTNQVRRAVGLRVALAELAPVIGSRPAHLLEIGSSAGLLLRQEHYGYRLGGRTFGDPASPVQLDSQWRGDGVVPDLDAVAPLTSVTGVDLNPLDPSDADDRRWLRALVWPEDRDKAALLESALDLAATIPVDVLAGDARQRCRPSSRRLPRGDVRIVFHCATRMHVPVAQRAAFDAAIAEVADDGPLCRVAIEGDGLEIAEPGQELVRRFDLEGHSGWIGPAT